MDPLDLIDSYGADALRFALTTGNSPGNDMRLNESRMEASRNFANKLWNAARFVLTNLDKADSAGPWAWPPTPAHLEDRWVLSRLNQVAAQVQRFMEEYQFGEAQRVVHDFLWSEYCDWYLEMSKVRLRAGDVSPLPFLAYVLERVLRLLHPFMPFITEELWQSLVGHLPEEPGRPDALIVAAYPEADAGLLDQDAESAIGAVVEAVRAIRNLRAEFRIDSSRKIEATIDAPSVAEAIRGEDGAIRALAQVEPLRFGPDGSPAGAGQEVSLVLSMGTVTVPLGGLVDLAAERERLSAELEQIAANLGRLSSRLDDEQFLSKAPEEVVERERQRLDGMKDRQVRVVETLSRLRA
jgi:valyl-tRNA synthetase